MAHRLVFMGSDAIALPALDWIASDAGRKFAEVVAVYTQPDRASGRGQKLKSNAIKAWATERGVPVRQPEKLTADELAAFRDFRPAAALVMAYGRILRQEWIDAPARGIWNLHVSLLPRHRGASPIQGAIASGDRETGVTLMRMVRRLDAGPMLGVERVPIEVFETAGSLEAKLAEACVPLLERHFPSVFELSPELRDQDETRATFTRRLRKDDGRIDFGTRADVLAKRINALFPWPGAYFEYRDEAIKVGLAEASPQSSSAVEPGTILATDAAVVVVAAAPGAVRLLKLQRPGGRMMSAAEFVRGHPLPPGTVLVSVPMTELVADRPYKG